MLKINHCEFFSFELTLVYIYFFFQLQQGDLILRVHAEDGDKGVPREVTYGLISEGNPFTPFFNVSETTGQQIFRLMF